MKKILVTGANGQLGSQLRQNSAAYTEVSFVFTDLPELNITSEEQIDQAFNEHQPDWLINCAAYTAVDKAESESDAAFLLNAHAPALLAKISDKHKCRMIHVSTDYVFDGTSCKPITEETPKNPQGVYAHTKSFGEDLVLANNPRSVIIRTSWLYSIYGQNFMKTVIRLAREKGSMRIVADQTGTPTWTGDLATAIMKCIESEIIPGVYHFSNEGICSWYDFAKAILEFSNLNCPVEPIATSEYPTPARRPFYSVLDKTLFKQTTGISIPYWRDSLKECISRLE